MGRHAVAVAPGRAPAVPFADSSTWSIRNRPKAPEAAPIPSGQDRDRDESRILAKSGIPAASKAQRQGAQRLSGYPRGTRHEVQSVAMMEAAMEQVAANLTPENLPQALEIAALPDQIRGYEHIKEQSIHRVQDEAAVRLGQMNLPILSQSTAR